MPDAIATQGIDEDLPDRPWQANDESRGPYRPGCPGRRGFLGFLGPNGAGKTTTIRMLTGLTLPTSGSTRVLGLDLLTDMPHIKKRIGVVPETSNLYDELSALDNLVFSMQLYGVPRAERRPRAEELLARFG